MNSRILLATTTIVLICMAGFLYKSFAAQQPVGLLIQAKGDVRYQTGNGLWKPVIRNKFVYQGWRVKTGPQSECKLFYQEANEVEYLGPNSEVDIREGGARFLQGSGKRIQAASSLSGFMDRKFAKVQKYTSVQRRATETGRIQLRTIEKIVLDPKHPDLVWENMGPEYSYRLLIGEKALDVPGGAGKLVRYKVSGIAPGNYPYLVQVIYMGEVLYSPSHKGELVWLGPQQVQRLEKRLRDLREIGGQNGYLLGNLYDEEGLKVAAMDQYQAYLTANPDADEARPFLIKVLHDLGLVGQVESQALLYKQSMIRGNN